MFHFFKNFKGNPDSLKNIQHENAFEEDVFKKLYDDESFDQIITNFEQFKTVLEKNEEIINVYLWSLWLFDGLEDKAYEQMQHYEQKNQTERWVRLKGHYVKWKQWYHLALEFYEHTDQEIYEEMEHIFTEFKELFEMGQFNKAIHFFDQHLHSSIGNNTLWVGEMYVYASFKTNKHVFDAKAKVDELVNTFPDHIPFLRLKAGIYAWIGQSYKDGKHIKEAITIYKELEQKEQVLALITASDDYLECESDFKKIVQKHITKELK